jgi:hypothetical protein
MQNTIIYEAYDFLRKTGIVENESEFSEDWLGASDCYLRTLRFKNAEPSMGFIAICASRLEKTGKQMVSTRRYKEIGEHFLDLSEKCHRHVNENGVEFDLAD